VIRCVHTHRLWSILMTTEVLGWAPFSTLDAPTSCPCRASQGALGRRSMPARIGMPRMEGRLASAVRPSSGTASKRQASSAPCAGEAFVLSQVNPELVV
jgi:hypothetical protein